MNDFGPLLCGVRSSSGRKPKGPHQTPKVKKSYFFLLLGFEGDPLVSSTIICS